MRPIKRFLAMAAAGVVILSSAGRLHAAYDVQTASVEVTYHAPLPGTYFLNVPSHDAFNDGPLQSISFRGGFDGGTSSGSTTLSLANNSGAAVTNQQTRVKISTILETGSPVDELLNGEASVYSPSYDLAASEPYHFQLTTLPTAYTGVSGVTTASVLDYFDGGGMDATLRLKTVMTAESSPNAATLDFTGSDGQISGTYDLTTVYKYDSNAAPTAPTVTLGSSTFGNFDGIETQWYRFFYPGGPLTIDTLGSTVDSDGSNDTMIALYGGSPTGSVLVSSNDNGAGFTGSDALLSQMQFNTGELTPGIYFIAVSPDGTAYEANDYNANPFDADAATGQYRLNINNPIPEPASALVLVAGLGILSLRRRRL